MTTIRIDDSTTLPELAEALAHLCHTAKRCVPKVGTDEYPTPWDRMHARIDALLDDMERAPA